MIDLAIDSRVFITTKLDEAVQELDMIFNTTNGELIGYSTFGTNFEQFLWQTNDASNMLQTYIYDKIKESFFLKDMLTEVNVSTLDGEIRRIYLVKISVSDGTDTQNRTYQVR